uniref:Uncharacterized protein n=1 Tax=Cucumis melo TaxID=3656 RepID=A0A9I9E6U3_CUCME
MTQVYSKHPPPDKKKGKKEVSSLRTQEARNLPSRLLPHMMTRRTTTFEKIFIELPTKELQQTYTRVKTRALVRSYKHYLTPNYQRQRTWGNT